MTRSRWAALGMAVLLAFYLAVVVLYAVRLITDPLPIVQAMGWALVVLPLLGVWALAVELRFGFRAEAITKRYLSEHGPAVTEEFDEAASRVREHPEQWTAWYLLALAYDAERDRRRARWALREAITRSRAQAPRL